jgi:hypothetical protein
MFVFTYECDACRFRGDTFLGQPAYYVFPDGSRMPASLSPAWCRHCNAFSSAEHLPTVEAVREEVERLRNGRTNELDCELAEEFNQTLAERVASRLAVFEQLDKRFRDRQSPNRCVACGTTEFDYLRAMDGAAPKEWPHIGCGGTFRLVETVHGIPATYITLDAEGIRISASDAE